MTFKEMLTDALTGDPHGLTVREMVILAAFAGPIVAVGPYAFVWAVCLLAEALGVAPH